MNIGDQRKAGDTSAAGDQRPAGETGPAGDPRQAGQQTISKPRKTKKQDNTEHTGDSPAPQEG